MIQYYVIYTVSQNKTRHLLFRHNFGKCEPIYKIFHHMNGTIGNLLWPLLLPKCTSDAAFCQITLALVDSWELDV